MTNDKRLDEIRERCVEPNDVAQRPDIVLEYVTYLLSQLEAKERVIAIAEKAIKTHIKQCEGLPAWLVPLYEALKKGVQSE